jgi:phosphatidylinositol glycan class B
MILGFGAWLLLIRRTSFRNLLMFATGIILATGLGVLADRWFYGRWVLTSWNYFFQNILLDKASGFGVSPWWYYIEQTFLNAFPPLSLVYVLAVFLYIWLFPRDVITWIAVPFLVVHFIVPHKEIRFLFPVIGLLPVMIVKTADRLLQKKGYELLERRTTKACVKIFWYLNMVMLVILLFRPADDHIALYKKLWNTYSGPSILYYTDDHPYHRAKVDVYFYKRNNLSFHKIDSIQQAMPGKDTAALFVTNKPLLPVNERFDFVPVYTSFPGWVRKFNINNWIERTSFWYVYEMKPVTGKN